MEPDEIAKTINHEQILNDKRKRPNFRKRWQDAEYRLKCYHSISICGAIFVLGCIAGQKGATLLDIQIITDTNLEQASAFLTSGAVGYLIGTFVCALIFEKINADLMLCLGGLLVGVGTFATPFCSYYELMIFITFVNSFIASLFDTGGNALLIRLWGTEGEQWMQFLHFGFGIGGVLSPLYSEPFLAPEMNEIETIANETSLNMTSNFTSNSSHPINPGETNVKYAFMISSVFAILISIPFVPFYFMNRKKVKQQKKEETRNQRKLPRVHTFFTLMLLCLFFMCYCSVEGTFANFLMTFLVREYDSVTKSKGAFVTAVFWASFASGRFFNVFLSRVLSLTRLLAMSVSLMLVAFTGFLISAQYGIINALTGFSVMAGLSMSGVYAAALSWTEEELLKVNGFITGTVTFFSALAGIVNPVILGYMMEEVSNMWFCYILLGATFLTGLVFVLLLVYSRCFLIRKFGPCTRISADQVGFQESFLKKHSERDT